MPQTVKQLLDAMLDATDCLGIGMVDRNGLLIHSSGLHAGKNPELIISHLQSSVTAEFERSLDDSFVEQAFIGSKYTFYLRWLDAHQYFLYAMTMSSARNSRLRYALQQLTDTLESSLTQLSIVTVSERLEHGKKLGSNSLIREAGKSILK